MRIEEMTEDEKLAEEYAEDFVKDKYSGNRHCAEVQEEKLFLKIGFQDGLNAGKPKWHDLRKDPNDLPKGQINRFLFGYVKNYGGKKPMIICYNGEWFYNANTYNDEVKVIAWCEIPQFEECEV